MLDVFDIFSDNGEIAGAEDDVILLIF
jgi:hypothetical protein